MQHMFVSTKNYERNYKNFMIINTPIFRRNLQRIIHTHENNYHEGKMIMNSSDNC
jgi:hypothetical protein